MSDRGRISPYNINTISSEQVMRIDKNNNYRILQLDPLPNSPRNTIRIVKETAGRISNPRSERINHREDKYSIPILHFFIFLSYQNMIKRAKLS